MALLLHQQALALDLGVPALSPELVDAHLIGESVAWIDALQAQILEMEYALMPEGLDIIGKMPTREQRLTTVNAIAQAMNINNPALLESLVDGASEKTLLPLSRALRW